ncbi:MAG: DUF3396 domain-containing protein [Polyangiaceae bacterium]
MSRVRGPHINDYLQEHPVRVALVASFFSVPSDANAAQAAGVYERFAERYGDKASFFSDAETDRVRRLDARSIAYPRRRWAKAKDGLLWGVSTTLDQEVPGEWNFVAKLRPPTANTLNYLWFTLDHAAIGHDVFLSLFLETARELRCRHGYGGLGIVAAPHPLASQESEESAIAITARFHGFDVLGAHRVSADATDGIKCVNWLTLVDAPLLAKLGGREALRSSLSSAIVFHDIPNGVVIQAGERPVAGDAHGPDELAAYREVARALKPIFAKGPFGRFRAMEDFQRYTTEWRERFFPGAKWPP